MKYSAGNFKKTHHKSSIYLSFNYNPSSFRVSSFILLLTSCLLPWQTFELFIYTSKPPGISLSLFITYLFPSLIFTLFMSQLLSLSLLLPFFFILISYSLVSSWPNSFLLWLIPNLFILSVSLHFLLSSNSFGFHVSPCYLLYPCYNHSSVTFYILYNVLNLSMYEIGWITHKL